MNYTELQQTGRVVAALIRRLGFHRLALEWPEDELATIACDPRVSPS